MIKLRKKLAVLLLAGSCMINSMSGCGEKAKDVNANQVAVGNYRTIDKNFISALKKAGFKTGVWQVQNLDDLAFAAELGVDRVCSDHAYELRRKYKLIKNLDFK